jgi:hypothetical protein
MNSRSPGSPRSKWRSLDTVSKKERMAGTINPDKMVAGKPTIDVPGDMTPDARPRLGPRGGGCSLFGVKYCRSFLITLLP